MAYIKKIWKDYPDTTTPILAEDMNNIEDGIEAVDTVLNSGWIDANETWTYASVDDPTGVITISGDVTTKYSLGMRIKFTNGGNTIYGIITKLAYSSPDTTMTFLHEIDPTDSLALHLMANSAITANYYSTMKVPFGFPLSPDKWSVISTYGTTFGVQDPVVNTWYSTPLSLIVPIGSWNIIGSGTSQVAGTSTTAVRVKTAISTSNNSISDLKNVTFAGYNIPTAGAQNSFSSSPIGFDTVLTSQTTFYFLLSTTMAGATQVTLVGTNNAGLAYIKATCAYL